MRLNGQLEEAQLENTASDPTNLPDGKVWLNTTDHKAKVYSNGGTHEILTNDQTQTLTNKTISGVSNTITNVPAANVVNTPTGNLAATDVQAALNELQTDVDTRATTSALSTHIADTSNPHAVTKTQVGLGNVDNTSDATKNAAVATLTNKTISGSSNTLTNIPLTTAVTGILPITNGGTGSNNAAGAFTNLAPMNAKGDLIVHDGTSPSKFAIGANNYVLTADSSQTSGMKWAPGGTGSGQKNYITNGDGEAASATGWSAFNTTWNADGTPGTITAGSAKITLSYAASNALKGTYSLNMSLPVATGSAGHGFITDAFTLDNADLARVLQGVMDYTFTTGGTAVDVSGTSTQTFEIWVYNVGLAAWTQPAGYKGINMQSGFGRANFTFQTDSSNASNKNQYRIAVIIKNIPSSAVVMNWEMACGPQAVTYSAPVTDWQSFTPTGTWTTNTSYTGKWRRVGDTMEVQTLVSLSGAPNAAVLNVNLPSGYSIDTAKVLGTSPDISYLGGGSALDAGIQNYSPLKIGYSTTTSVAVYVPIASGTYATGTFVNATTPFTFGNGDFVAVNFTVPITGWSSSVQMSSDSSEGRVVAFRVGGTPTGTLNGSFNQATFPTIASDTHGTYSSGVWTCPSPGFYDFAGGVSVTGATVTQGNYVGVQIQKNGAPIATNMSRAGFTSANATSPTEVAIDSVYCNAGETIRLCVASSYTTPSYAALLDGTEFFFSGAKRSGNQSIAASETQSAEFCSSAANTLANNTVTYIDFATKDGDTNGLVLGAGSGNVTTTNTGWRFIAQTAGRYQVDVMYAFVVGSSPSAGAQYTIQLRVNDTGKASNLQYAFAATNTYTLPIAKILRLNAGDRVELVAFQNSGQTLTQSTNSALNYISITRVGN